jgi:hypothetical protein
MARSASTPAYGPPRSSSSVLDGREQGTNVAEIIVKVDRIIAAVKSSVPQSMWGEITRKLNGAEQHRGSLDVETKAIDQADDVYDPTEFAEEDDELDTYHRQII